MCRPLNISEGLSLENSFIEGTEWKKAVVDFKKKGGWNPFDEKSERKAILGQKWYKNIWTHHSHLLERKKGHEFSKDHSKWSIHRNLSRCMMKFAKLWSMQELQRSCQSLCGLMRSNK